MTVSNPSHPTHVLHLITRLIVGGAQENTLYTALLLDRAKYRVEVVSGPQTGSEGSLIEEARQHGIPLTILPDLLRQISPLHDLRALIRLRKILMDEKYTILHTHSSKAGILGRTAARLAGAPLIVHTVHGWSFHDYMHPLIRWTYILLERWTATFTDALVVVAEKDIQKGLQAGIGHREQYHLIRSAIPLDEFDPAQFDRAEVRRELGLPAGSIVIGNVGRFSVQKNPLDWVRVAGQVASACPEAWFLLVGDGPLRDEVLAEVRRQGIADRTVFSGLRRDVGRMLAAMDIFLLTSLWEGLPRVVPQALAMGLPIVANQADGTQEAVIDGVTGWLCQPGDTRALAERCIQLAGDPTVRLEMGTQGQLLARAQFDLAVMIAQIDELYSHLLSSKNQ